jgi:membrane-bound ClpP family serine protease
LDFSTKHGNHKQSIIFLLVAVFFVVPSGSTIVDYIIAVANLVFAQQQDNDNNNNDAEHNREIRWVDVKDFISSGTAEDISAAIQSISPAARSSSFSVVILALDTPGGSLDATFDIIDAIQQSPVPVIGYVSRREGVHGPPAPSYSLRRIMLQWLLLPQWVLLNLYGEQNQ